MKVLRVAVVSLLLAVSLIRPMVGLLALPHLPVRGAGALDATFGGGDGVVTTSIGIAADSAYDLARQTDDKLVAAGSTYNTPDGTSDFLLARYNPDGSLDTSLGGVGTVSTPIGPGYDAAEAVAIQSDGKIVVAGDGNGRFAVARYDLDGTLDAGFDGDGIVTTSVAGGSNWAYDLALQPDGKIVAAGFALNAQRNNDFALVRYNPDGELDTTFSGDGIVITPIGAYHDFALSVAIQPDGKIVAAGNAYGSSGYDFAVARYKPTGRLDRSFGSNGIITTSITAEDDIGLAAAIQDDGKLLVAGGAGKDVALARYTPDGSLDSSFSEDGILTTSIGSTAVGNDLALGLDGKIVVAGSAFVGGSDDFAALRYAKDGSLDPSFGSDGIVTSAIGLSTDRAYGVAIQGDGKIVLAGESMGGTSYDIALARYLYTALEGSGVLSDFNGDGYGDLAIGVPGEDIGSNMDTGGVNVLYGSAGGLTSSSSQFWDESATGATGDASGDLFGWALATGDFDGDGFADLAVGAPGSYVDGIPGAGIVCVLYGSPIGSPRPTARLGIRTDLM